MIGTMVALHAVDYRAVGLEGFGHPEGYLERQVRRWSQQWERSKTGELAEIDALIRRLRGALPASPPPTIVHGDFRLGNMALDPERSRAASSPCSIGRWRRSAIRSPISATR